MMKGRKGGLRIMVLFGQGGNICLILCRNVAFLLGLWIGSKIWRALTNIPP